MIFLKQLLKSIGPSRVHDHKYEKGKGSFFPKKYKAKTHQMIFNWDWKYSKFDFQKKKL